jgi:uncharacterized protein YegL
MKRFNRGYVDQPLDATGMVFDGDVENHNQRVPVVMLIDTSSSMEGKPIGLLNDALAEMEENLHEDVELSNKAEICLITFGHGGVTAWRGDEPAPAGASPFVPAREFRVPKLQAGGVTPMVEAIKLGMRHIAEEKQRLRARRLSYYRPVMWCVGDGCPTNGLGQISDDWRHLPAKIAAEEAAKRFAFFSVSVGDISAHGEEVLSALAPKSHLKLQGFEFAVVLQLVSASAESAAQDNPIDAIKEKVMREYRQKVIPKV